MSKKYKYLEERPVDYYDKFTGPKEKRVAVLGSFDTWSYMHKICIDVVKNGYAVYTSRYTYVPDDNLKPKYYRTARDPTDATVDEEGMAEECGGAEKTGTEENNSKLDDHRLIDMNTFLKEFVINKCSKAIIVYSVPAAHYNEADWCKEEAIKRKLKTLGIVFVRSIDEDDYCPDCVVDHELDISFCVGDGTAWDCISKNECPFKKQGMAKNQLEYFLQYRDHMSLIAIEKIEKTYEPIKNFLKGTLLIPFLKNYIYEYRYDLDKDEYENIDKKIENIFYNNEEKAILTYEYVDYYYKPKSVEVEEWINGIRTLRIRKFDEQRIPDVDVFSSELIQHDEGFITYDPFGRLKWYSGSLDRSKKLLSDYNMNHFLKVFKIGKMCTFFNKYYYKIYLERIKLELPEGENENEGKVIDYGFSIEIELWIRSMEDNEQITKMKDHIKKLLKLNDKKLRVKPIQYIIYNWALENLY